MTTDVNDVTDYCACAFFSAFQAAKMVRRDLYPFVTAYVIKLNEKFILK